MLELQIVKGHRLDLGENRVARRIDDFPGDVGFEVLLAERDDFEFCKNAMLGNVAVVEFREPADEQRCAIGSVNAALLLNSRS